TRGWVANWRETLKFLFGRRVEERDQSVMTNLAWQLLQHVEQQTPLQVPALAVVCCDAVHLLLDRGYQLPDEMQGCVRRLFRHSLEQLADLSARDQLGLLVSRIGDDRPELDLRTAEAWVTVPFGEYSLGENKDRRFVLQQPVEISRFPVTNAEFRKFVLAGGYDQQAYWKSGWKAKCERNWTAPARRADGGSRKQRATMGDGGWAGIGDGSCLQLERRAASPGVGAVARAHAPDKFMVHPAAWG
ncbi:MAG: SUMF1/EgtB/PvdO family nonheme iron enzyme, partial [Planctomyces sp.]